MQVVLNGAASTAFDNAVEKYSQVLNRLGQEFEDRFCEFDQLEPCVSFVTNPFMQVDMTCTAEQLSAYLFNLDAGQVEIEILMLQNDLHLKPISLHQTFGALWTEKSTAICEQSLHIYLYN